MTSSTYSLLSIIFFVLAGVFFILAILFWFLFKIKGVIGDLSGATAKKSIARMRQSNEEKGKQDAAKAAAAPLFSMAAEQEEAATGMMETGLLQNGVSQYPAGDDMATELLSKPESVGTDDGSGVTEWLVDTNARIQRKASPNRLEMIEEILLVHTLETL